MPETGSSSRLFTGRCALVPAQFFEPGSARAMLVEVSEVDDAETVSSVAIPYYDAVLVYAHQAGETALPELYHLLKASESISDHNRILASYHEGRLYLVVVEDMSTDGDEVDVRLVPVGERFTARARHDPELGGPSLRGFWLA